MAQLLPNGKQQFCDANGLPLGAGTVDFYIPGTTTRKDTWLDAAQGTLNANPVPLDASGRAIIYGNGDYRQIVKDALGNTIWDQLTSGPFSTLTASSGSSLIGFQQSGTGSRAMTVQEMLGLTINAAQFLPAGYVTDGSVDYTTQLQATLDAAKAKGVNPVFPAGTFTVSGTGLSITLSNTQQMTIIGQGTLGTIIRSTSGPVLRLSGTFLNARDICLRGDGGGHVVQQTGPVAKSYWQHVYLAQNVDGYSVWDNGGFAFIDNHFSDNLIQHTTTSTVYGFNLVGIPGTINDNVWFNSTIQNSGTKHFFNIESTGPSPQFANCFESLTFEVCIGGGIRIRGSDFIIKNCQNWDTNLVGAIVNDFYDIDRDSSGTGCLGTIEECGRWAGVMASGKYDVALPTGGGGNGIRILNCRTAGSGDPFTVNARGNFIFVVGLFTLLSITNNTGVIGFDLGTQGFDISGVKVVGPRDTGWTAMTGTGSKAALAAAAAGTANATYLQSDIQGALNRVAALEARLKSYDAALVAHGLIGA